MSELDRQIADIRKKYAEDKQSIKTRLTEEDSFKPSVAGPGLRRLQSMNYEHQAYPSSTTPVARDDYDYPSKYLNTQIDNYLQDSPAPRLALRKQATMYERPSYNY